MADELEEVESLVDRLGLDPDSDTALWILQQEEAGVKAVDILVSLADGNVTPARFRRVPLDVDLDE
jgi:hypothetical protein